MLARRRTLILTMGTPGDNPYKGWFQRLARGEIEPAGYEPLSLGLIPILLRSRKQYYQDAVATTRKLIDWYWETSKTIYPSRAHFEGSDFIQGVWEREAPLWWGLNDIIGWIDVRLCVRAREFQISVFLPTKRISRVFQNKAYFCHFQESIKLPGRSTNAELRKVLIKGVEKVAADRRLRRRYLNLGGWRSLVQYLDLIGLIRVTAEADIELLMEAKPKLANEAMQPTRSAPKPRRVPLAHKRRSPRRG